MIAIFTLSMTKVNTWNGKWSGEENPPQISRKVSSPISGEFFHDFGDGWEAKISVETLDSGIPQEGDFFGYEWMVDSIIKSGRIQ